jgi:hypothetical protein
MNRNSLVIKYNFWIAFIIQVALMEIKWLNNELKNYVLKSLKNIKFI